MPISATIKTLPHEKISSMKKRAIQKILIERGWNLTELTEKYHYTKIRFIKVE